MHCWDDSSLVPGRIGMRLTPRSSLIRYYTTRAVERTDLEHGSGSGYWKIGIASKGATCSCYCSIYLAISPGILDLAASSERRDRLAEDPGGLYRYLKIHGHPFLGAKVPVLSISMDPEHPEKEDVQMRPL